MALAEVSDPSTDTDRDSDLADGWALREGFPDVPEDLLQRPGWKTIFAGPFRIAESISVKEARALLWAQRWAARTPERHGTKRLFVVDNFGVACCMARGRAASFGLSPQSSWQPTCGP